MPKGARKGAPGNRQPRIAPPSFNKPQRDVLPARRAVQEAEVDSRRSAYSRRAKEAWEHRRRIQELRKKHGLVD